MHEENSFITLTYADEHLNDPKLNYEDFQKFMKRLRSTYPNQKIGFFATGEYGEQTKRPHWHAIIFDWFPRDATKLRSNDRGDTIYSSETLDKIWGKGNTETGTVSMDSANYCARYAAKKLVHGNDDEHEYQPISKKSNQRAIGKAWLEIFHADVFNHGELITADGVSMPIPRYYERWYKENHPEEWLRYIEEVKIKKMERADARQRKEKYEFFKSVNERPSLAPWPNTRLQVKKIILDAKFEMLQKHLKL